MTPAQIAGKVVVFTGNESKTWSLADVITACATIRRLGADTLCMKYADGGISWHSPNDMEHYHAVANGLGCGLCGFQYCYGPAFGDLTKQVTDEAAIANSMIGHLPLIVLDMEKEFDGHPEAAIFLHQHLQVPPGQLAITTWANPAQHAWIGDVAALNQDAIWIPQEYTSFLAKQDRSSMTTIWPAIDLSSEFGPNDPVGIIAHAHPASAWVWALSLITRGEPFQTELQQICHEAGNPAPPPRPAPATTDTITVQQYPALLSTLWGIALQWGTNAQAVYNRNQKTIEDAAHEHGLPSSDNGNIIYEGEVLYRP